MEFRWGLYENGRLALRKDERKEMHLARLKWWLSGIWWWGIYILKGKLQDKIKVMQ